jgi:hypothetical protein
VFWLPSRIHQLHSFVNFLQDTIGNNPFPRQPSAENQLFVGHSQGLKNNKINGRILQLMNAIKTSQGGIKKCISAEKRRPTLLRRSATTQAKIDQMSSG